jgi:hypothetical protein
MKKLYFIALCIVCAGGISLLSGVLVLRHVHGHKMKNESGTVYIKKTQNGYGIIRNGKPFYINGAAGYSHFNELTEAGGNTIRIYDTVNLASILDEAYLNNLAVIVDIPIPPFSKMYDFYADKENIIVLKQSVKELVKKNKNHPSVLMWNLGNELNHPFQLRKNMLMKTFNELIEIIKEEDPNHPVSTAIDFVSRKMMANLWFRSRKLDVIGFNIFGNVEVIHPYIKFISFIFGKRPYYVSEYGSDGPWEAKYTAWGAPIESTSVKKAEQIETRYHIITSNDYSTILGSLIFIWGNKFETTHTWFSMFSEDYKVEIIRVLESLWKNSSAKPDLIGLEYMLVDSKGAADNIMFSPNELKNAELIFSDTKIDSLKIVWEIYPEFLNIAEGEIKSISDKSIGSFVSFEDKKASFITPEKEGPYRIFAYVYDKDGYFATTNTPFYILNPK